MKYLFVPLIFILNFLSYAQENKMITLENTLTGKTKTLNLERASYMTLYIDSLYDSNTAGISYTTYDPTKSTFGKQEMIFKFEEFYSYNDLWNGESNYYSENYGYLENDSLIKLPYTNENRNIDLRLTYQTRFRNFLSTVGAGICVAAIVNAVIVSPIAGLNNGSFSNYNWSRFLQYELYSAGGLAAGLTLGVCFMERDFYFQTTSSYYKTWSVK